MRYEHARSLLAYARLQLEIAVAQNPTLEIPSDLAADAIEKSHGYAMLRDFASRLSPKKRARFCADLDAKVKGVRDVLMLAKASGEAFSLADIEIDQFNKATGEIVPDNPATDTAEAIAAQQQRHDDRANVLEQLINTTKGPRND